jgi:aminopeptidase N
VYDKAAQTLTLKLRQKTLPTPGQPDKSPVPIPVRFGLLTTQGEPMTYNGGTASEGLHVLRTEAEDIVLTGVTDQPVLSALRHFSAPVILTIEEPREHAFARFKGDTDPFNRWEAAQGLARAIILDPEPAPSLVDSFADGLRACLEDDALAPAFKALILALPTEADLAQSLNPIDPAFIHKHRSNLKVALSRRLSALLHDLYNAIVPPVAFSPDADAAGLRALRNALLDLMLAGYNDSDNKEGLVALAEAHFVNATNMTDMVGGISALMPVQGQPYQKALDAFYHRFKAEPLVIDKWFALQSGCPHPATLERVQMLKSHPDFDARTPNRWRALVQGFANNQSVFHDTSGAGYAFLTEQVLMVDSFNPMTAARLVEPLSRFRFYAAPWSGLMKDALQTIARAPNLSKNVAELVGKALEG